MVAGYRGLFDGSGHFLSRPLLSLLKTQDRPTLTRGSIDCSPALLKSLPYSPLRPSPKRTFLRR